MSNNLKKQHNLYVQIKFKVNLLRAGYFILTFLNFILVFGSSILTVFYLAANLERYRDNIPNWNITSGNIRDQYLLLASWLTSGATLSTSILSFFTMYNKYKIYNKQLINMRLEKALYSAKIGIYKNAYNPDYIFLERTMTILQYNKRFILKSNKKEKHER